MARIRQLDQAQSRRRRLLLPRLAYHRRPIPHHRNHFDGRGCQPISVMENGGNEERQPIISIAEYRRIMKDETSTDEKIIARLQYLESFFRNIIRIELEKCRAD